VGLTSPLTSLNPSYLPLPLGPTWRKPGLGNIQRVVLTVGGDSCIFFQMFHI
jgi:hypothetical protein